MPVDLSAATPNSTGEVSKDQSFGHTQMRYRIIKYLDKTQAALGQARDVSRTDG